MANPQHIDWLLEGAEAWNARREKEAFRPDFEGADILGAFVAAGKLNEFGRLDLDQVNLEGADLEGANLADVNLSEAHLEKANLGLANLVGAELQQANLGLANLRGADVLLANLRLANLAGADLEMADLQGANLEGANLHRAKLKGADLERADLERADLQGADLSHTNLNLANLTDTFVGNSPEPSRNALAFLPITDLSSAKNLTQDQLDSMLGDSGTIIPNHLTRPGHWPELELNEELDENEDGSTPQDVAGTTLPTSPLAKVPAILDVYWEDGRLSGDFLLSVRDPIQTEFHPTPAPAAEMDMLASLGQLAGQLLSTLETDKRENVAAFIGDICGPIDAIKAEVGKSDGLVLSFIIHANLRAIEVLAASGSEALRDVDQALLSAFFELGQLWRDGSPIVQNVYDPTGSEFVPEDKLDEIDDKINELITVVNSEDLSEIVSPKLAGVTRDMALYPWDPTNPDAARRKRAGAFGKLAWSIREALTSPPGPVETRLGVLLGIVISILSLFR